MYDGPSPPLPAQLWFQERVALSISASNAVKLFNLGNLKHIVHQRWF